MICEICLKNEALYVARGWDGQDYEICEGCKEGWDASLPVCPIEEDVEEIKWE